MGVFYLQFQGNCANTIISFGSNQWGLTGRELILPKTALAKSHFPQGHKLDKKIHESNCWKGAGDEIGDTGDGRFHHDPLGIFSNSGY